MDYKEAAKRLNISVGTVYNWLKIGKLEGFKTETGEWDISVDSVNKILGQYQHEADLVKFEILVDKYLKEQETSHLQMIHHFCKDFIELYEAGNPNAFQAAEKIAERVQQVQELKKTGEHVKDAASDEFTGFEEMTD